MTKEGAEVDFVAVNHSGQPFVLQVCFDAGDEKTMKREQQSLKAACKELGCEGMLLSPAVYCQGKEWLPGL